MVFQIEPDCERLRHSTRKSLCDHLAVYSLGNPETRIKVCEQVKPVELAEHDQRPGIDEGILQMDSAQLFRERLGAEGWLQTPRVGVTGQF